MIKFENWHIANQGELLARQFDNLTRELRVEGDIPEGWTWDLLIQAGKNLDIISLSQSGDALRVTLTAEMLALDGYYALQLRGTQGEKVQHTNVLQVYVPESLSGDAQWPELPSEFSQAEAAIRELNAHPPIPGDEGFWLTWDLEAQQYSKSGLPLPDVAVGADGGYYTPSVEQLTETTMTISFVASKDDMPPIVPVQVTLPRGKQGDPGTPGKNGDPGKDGISPVAVVEQTETGATVTITDATGTTTAEVKNGKDGAPGTPGNDGISPQASVQQTDTGVIITITDKSGTTTAECKNGKDGAPGEPGKTPEKGVDYWTEADKQEIVAATVAALPVYNGEVQGGA